MPHAEFRFKQFIVRQDKCAMKVGTDGVLLGAWAACNNCKRVLDIGTGTGLIALMMAQKCPNAEIFAIDIDSVAYRQANENFGFSPWSSRLHALHESLQQFALLSGEKFDLIISNPPFFMDAHPASNEARNVARHMDESLSIIELCEGVKKLLSPDGKFCVIFPYREGMRFLEYASANNLFIERITKVKTKVEKQEKRLLMEFGLTHKQTVEEELVIQEEDLSFTQQYIDLTADFYLALGNR
ncbi:MAG TPA: methyltransferase [Bacteroidia bacterium]|nr:methyltransferase [Bacteroidia bacterium]